MDWTDNAVILSAKLHGESSAIVNLLTPTRGRHAGFVRGINNKRLRGVIQPGNLVKATWRARLEEHLGNFSIELLSSNAANYLYKPFPLSALAAACALCRETLAEREVYPEMYEELVKLLSFLGGTNECLSSRYVLWELSMLRALGFGLDLSSCAVTGARENLVWVSPRSGRAVSRSAGKPYRDRLLDLPEFLLCKGEDVQMVDVMNGLKLTGHFLEEHVLRTFGKMMPAARIRFVDQVSRCITISGID